MPISSLAYANRASAFGNLGDLSRQIADCNKAIELDSSQVLSLRNAIAMCEVFRCEASRHLGEACTIDETWTQGFGEADRAQAISEWLEDQ